MVPDAGSKGSPKIEMCVAWNLTPFKRVDTRCHSHFTSVENKTSLLFPFLQFSTQMLTFRRTASECTWCTTCLRRGTGSTPWPRPTLRATPPSVLTQPGGAKHKEPHEITWSATAVWLEAATIILLKRETLLSLNYSTFRFSPEDKYSRQRITIKKRFNLLPTQGPAQEY